MKIKLKRLLGKFALLIAILMPTVSLAERNLQAEAINDAERDAQNDVNTSLWFLGGCLGGVVGVIVAYAVEPSPPIIRLLGKSPEYVAFYTDAYSQTARKRQVNSALVGCAVNGLGVAVIYGVAIAAAVGASTY